MGVLGFCVAVRIEDIVVDVGFELVGLGCRV